MGILLAFTKNTGQKLVERNVKPISIIIIIIIFWACQAVLSFLN